MSGASPIDSTPVLRRAGPDDAPALALVGAATMLETYADKVPGPDIVAHCMNRHSIAVYEAWLADPAIAIWLAETAKAAAVGYLVLMPATLPDIDPGPNDLEVQRIYLLSRFHGGGVGHRLMRTAIEEALARHAPQVVLGVLRANTRAVAFYQRQGFRPIGDRRFQVGASTFDDHVMGLQL